MLFREFIRGVKNVKIGGVSAETLIKNENV